MVGRPLDDRSSSPARGGATPTPTRSSCAHTRGSRCAPRTSSPATPPTPRRPRRTPSSRPTGRSGGSARAPFKPWLLRIVANEARNRRRSAGRRAALALRATQEPSGEAAPSPEAVLLAGERREELIAALNRLAEHDREALTCRYFLELSEAETAAALGVRPGTVKSRLSRALERLRAELGGGGHDRARAQSLAAFVDFPAERDLAPAVRARLRRVPGAGARWCSSWPRSCSPSRSPSPSRPPARRSSASSTCAARASSVVDRLPEVRTTAPLDLGSPISLADAEQTAGFRPLTSILLGDPDRVTWDGGMLWFRYGDVRLLVSQFRGTERVELIKKVLEPRTHDPRRSCPRARATSSPAPRTSSTWRRPT